MKEINIGKTIINKRKEKGITQDDLANFIGVSKASVSKWETGQSYPDITFLPQLASYFDISLDELMGYEPQMTNEDINKLYKKLCTEFATRPFEEVKSDCYEIMKKYFSCFPLLFQIGVLFTNYGWTAKDDEQKTSTIAEAKELFVRVKEQSNDICLKQAALNMEATCEMMLGNPNAIINLLEDIEPFPPYKTILSQAYLMLEETTKAKTILQESIYENILELFNTIPNYLAICEDDGPHFEELYKRAVVLIETFNLKYIFPTHTMSFYLAAAQGYLAIEKTDKSLDSLETYTSIATSGDMYPLKLVKKDNFFNLIGDYDEQALYGTAELPRDEKTIKQSMADAVIENPLFTVLANEPRFISLSEKLKNNIGR